MISGTLPISREDSLLHKLGIVLLAICIAVPAVFGLWKLSLGALFVAALLLYFRRLEDRFLFWLLTFSLFSVDSTTFLSVGGHPILSFDRVFIAILLFLFLKEIVLNERRPLRISSVEVIYLLLLFLMGLHIMFITLWQKSATRYFVDAFFLPFVVFIIAKNCLSEKEHFVKFAKTLFVVGIYISLMAVYEHLTRHDLLIEPAIYGGMRITEGQWLRVNGPYQRDYVLGICCLICFFVALYKYSITKKTNLLHHIFYISTLTVITIATFLSFYRGIWLAWALGLFTWFITRKRGLGKLTFALLALAILAVPFIATLQSSDFYDQRIANIETIEFRFERFGIAWSFFKENPLFGMGFRNFRTLTGTSGQHNQILAYLSEMGIIGASLYVALLFMLLYHAVKRYNATNNYARKEFIRAFLCILFAIVCYGLVDDYGFDKQINLLFFAVAGVALSSPRKQARKVQPV